MPATPTPPGRKPFEHRDAPRLSWYLDPLPVGQQSAVQIVMKNGQEEPPSRSSDEWRTRIEPRQRKLIELRPEAVGWISTVETHGLADVFQTAPLAPLVYEWLKSDLTTIKWQ
jgi:hypothetical protein